MLVSACACVCARMPVFMSACAYAHTHVCMPMKLQKDILHGTRAPSFVHGVVGYSIDKMADIAGDAPVDWHI